MAVGRSLLLTVVFAGNLVVVSADQCVEYPFAREQQQTNCTLKPRLPCTVKSHRQACFQATHNHVSGARGVSMPSEPKLTAYFKSYPGSTESCSPTVRLEWSPPNTDDIAFLKGFLVRVESYDFVGMWNCYHFDLKHAKWKNSDGLKNAMVYSLDDFGPLWGQYLITLRSLPKGKQCHTWAISLPCTPSECGNVCNTSLIPPKTISPLPLKLPSQCRVVNGTVFDSEFSDPQNTLKFCPPKPPPQGTHQPPLPVEEPRLPGEGLKQPEHPRKREKAFNGYLAAGLSGVIVLILLFGAYKWLRRPNKQGTEEPQIWNNHPPNNSRTPDRNAQVNVGRWVIQGLQARGALRSEGAASEVTGITDVSDVLEGLNNNYDDECAHNDNTSVAPSSTLTDLFVRNEQRNEHKIERPQKYAPIAESSNEQCSSSSTLGKNNGNFSADLQLANGVPPVVSNRLLNDAASEASGLTDIRNQHEYEIEKRNSLRGSSSDTVPLLVGVIVI